MKIGEIAASTGVKAELIRYYERIGLVERAPRSSGNYRAYSQAHVERLNFIKDCREPGLDIDDIRTFLRSGEDVTGGKQSKDGASKLLKLVRAKAEALQRIQAHLTKGAGTRN